MPKTIFILYSFMFPLFATAQTADFTFQSSNGLLCSPSTVQFTQTSTGNPIGFVWDFGNNTRGYTGNESVLYNTPGSFTVKLIVIYEQNTVEVSKTIVINPAVTASIGYDKNFICNPGPINFTGITSGNTVNYAWDFGDSTGTINAVTKDTAHDYTVFGTYAVTLKATDASGCIGSATTTIKVVKPPITATATPSSGCIPANVNFNSTISVPVNDFVSSYTWNFGDGSPDTTTTVKNTTHQYSATGFYSSTLNITTSNGCTNTFNFPSIGYGTPPVNHVAYAKKTVVCGSETPVFVSKATNANRYSWNFGDGVTATVADTITQHKYSTLGPKIVRVTPYFNGCPGTQITFTIQVIGVISKFGYSNTCNNRKTYAFGSGALGNVTGILWQYGDNSLNDSTTNPTHTFPTSGEFITQQTVTDSVSGCSDSTAIKIYTADPVVLNPDSSICKNSTTNFSIVNSYTDNAATYTWNVAGVKVGPTTDTIITVKASTLGNFNNFVSIKYGPGNSCLDTILLDHSFLVKGPDLKFNSPSPICFNTVTTLTNASQPFVPEDSIILMYWNYGNSIVNDTIYQPLPFQYKNPGNFRVILTATDIQGCQDSLIQFIRVNPNPFLKVIPHVDTLCIGQSHTLIAFSSADVLWSPVTNISCTTCDTVAVNPGTTTKYYITATTPLNCSVQDSVLIKVYTPFTATAPTDKFYICLNGQAQLDIEPKINKILWTPATGLSNSTIFNPIASPLQSTTYTAVISDSVGCFSDSVSINVTVNSLPTVDAGPDKVLSYNSTYTIAPNYSDNIVTYAWSPTALLSCSDCATPGGIATYSENYTIKVTSDSGCIASDSIRILVECKSANIFMPTAFTPNNDNLNDFYYPITRGIKTISKFVIFNRQGQIVYENSNFAPNSTSLAWDGKFKGVNQPQGAYAYVMEALCELGEKLTKTGSFVLLR